MTSNEKLIKSVLGPDAEEFEYQVSGNARKGWRLYFPGSDNHPDESAVARVDSHWRVFHEQDIRLFIGPSLFRIAPNRYADSYEVDPATEAEPPPSVGQIFALPGATPLDVVEFCKVGSHNAHELSADTTIDLMKHRIDLMGPDARAFFDSLVKNKDVLQRQLNKQPHGPEPWRNVQKSLARIMKIVPYEIQFADSAGLHATFVTSVTAAKAEKITKIIFDLNPEAGELPIEDLQALQIPVPMDPEMPDIPDYEAAMIKYIVATSRFRLWWD